MKSGLVHVPLQPARESHPEASFLAAWREVIDRDPEFIDRLFGNLPWKFNQRCAQVAASFVTWLGTNAGAAFIAQANNLAPKFTWIGEAYIAAWAFQNMRAHYRNSNFRTVEFILARRPLTTGVRFEQDLGAYAELQISILDLDVIETLVLWLSTDDGDRFIGAATAKAEYDRLGRELMARTAHNSQ